MATHQHSVHTDQPGSRDRKSASLGEILKTEFSLPDIIAKLCMFRDPEAVQQQSSASIFPDAKSDAGNSASSDISWLAESELDRVSVNQKFGIHFTETYFTTDAAKNCEASKRKIRYMRSGFRVLDKKVGYILYLILCGRYAQ
jgi:hypothetical protein